MKGGEYECNRTAYDHSYYYLQRAKELHKRDVITHRVRGMIWDDLPKQVVTTMKTLQEVREMNCWHCNTELIWGGDH